MSPDDKAQVSSRLYLVPIQTDIDIPNDMRAAYSCFWFIGKDASKKILSGFQLTAKSIKKLEKQGFKIVSKTGTTKNVHKRLLQMGSDLKKFPNPSIDMSSRLVAKYMLDDREAECVILLVFVGLWGDDHNTYSAEAKVKNEFLIPLGCMPSNMPAFETTTKRTVTRSNKLDIVIDIDVPMIF